MKRNIAFSFIMATLIGLSLVANAQTEKGKILLDASSSLDFTSLSSKWETDYNSGDGGKTSSFDFSPAVGYFVANNLAFGIMLELSTTTEKDDYDKYTTSSSIVMPFAVYYFGKSNVKPYVQGGLGPGWGKEKSHPSGDPSVTIKTNLFSYAFGGGLAIFLYDNIALDFGLGYASATSKWKDLSNVEWKNTMNGFSSSIGISVIF